MRFAIVRNGVVINVASAAGPLHENWIELPDGQSAKPGDSYDEQTGEFSPGPGPIPQTITRHQLRVALHRTGNLAAAKAWIDDPGTDPEIRIAMQDATLFHRSSPSLAALAAALGYGEQALDNLFRSVAGLEP